LADVFTPEKRSYVMSRIRYRDTKIELKMEKILKDNHITFREHPRIFGSPDFLVGKKILVFCDGDFWHGYNYDVKKKPSGKFWRKKIERNMKRDQTVTRKLRRDGWSVLRFWEHDVEKRFDMCLRRIKKKSAALKK